MIDDITASVPLLLPFLFLLHSQLLLHRHPRSEYLSTLAKTSSILLYTTWTLSTSQARTQLPSHPLYPTFAQLGLPFRQPSKINNQHNKLFHDSVFPLSPPSFKITKDLLSTGENGLVNKFIHNFISWLLLNR